MLYFAAIWHNKDVCMYNAAIQLPFGRSALPHYGRVEVEETKRYGEMLWQKQAVVKMIGN